MSKVGRAVAGLGILSIAVLGGYSAGNGAPSTAENADVLGCVNEVQEFWAHVPEDSIWSAVTPPTTDKITATCVRYGTADAVAILTP